MRPRIREGLKALCGKRIRCQGTIVSYSTMKAKYGDQRTVLLHDVTSEDGETMLADHLWVRITPTWEHINPGSGDRVCFSAQVKSYYKGFRRSDDYRQRKLVDYHLIHPSKLSLLASTSASASTNDKGGGTPEKGGEDDNGEEKEEGSEKGEERI